MTNQIEPYSMMQKTNIKEHNDMIDKINEIVDVINDVNLDTINAEISTLKTKATKTDGEIADIKDKDAAQDTEIADLKPRVAMTESEIANLKSRADKTDSNLTTIQAKDITQDTEIEGITKSLVSDVIMSDGTTMGSVQVCIEREDGAVITSKNYKWGRDIGIRLEAGSQVGYVKAVIDLSDGTVLESNEYRIVEVLESDIYVTAITFLANQTDGTLGGKISYSNGTTQTINSVSVPTAPGVTSALESLQSRMSAVEQKNTTQDGQISALHTRVKAIEDTPGVGQFDRGKLGTIAGSTVDGRIASENDGTGSVNGWSVLKDRVTSNEGQISNIKSQISGIMADISNIESKNTEQDSAINGKISIFQGTANAGKTLKVGTDGNVNLEDDVGGEVWEELDLNNLPDGSSLTEGTRIKIHFKTLEYYASNPTNWNGSFTNGSIVAHDYYGPLLEMVWSPSKNIDIRQPVSVSFPLDSWFSIIWIHGVMLRDSYYIQLSGKLFNGNQCNNTSLIITKTNMKNYVNHIWICRP